MDLVKFPFYIDCKVCGASLYERRDGRFQIVKLDPLAPFLAGHQYLLIEKALADFLQGLDLPLVRYESAVMFNPVTGEEHHTHVRVCVDHVFDSKRIEELPLDGLRLFRMGDCYHFASPELKARLRKSRRFSYLSFSRGLEGFGG